MAIAIVAGALANKPFNGGEAWVRLSWALGLAQLGFETYLVEELSSGACVGPAGEPSDFASCENRRWFESVARDFGLEGRAALLCQGESAGIPREELLEIAAEAELLFNLSGNLTTEALLEGPRLRVYVDLDPGFTQAWHADPALPFHIDAHDRYVTVGLNVGGDGWPIASGGIDWLATPPPVLLDEWPVAPLPASPMRLTTVATWRSPSGTVEIGGRPAGLKHHEFRRVIELPERVPDTEFELALDLHPADAADREALEAHGWGIASPLDVAATPQGFREYVAESSAEFSVAQGVYVESRSGWFSDRTAAYLASGRPVLVQDTGIGRVLPVGEGLVTFDSLDRAAAAVQEIAAEPQPHAEAARRIAEEHLDSDIVLGHLLERLGAGCA